LKCFCDRVVTSWNEFKAQQPLNKSNAFTYKFCALIWEGYTSCPSKFVSNFTNRTQTL